MQQPENFRRARRQQISQGHFRKRSHLHVERKIWHATTVSVMALGYLFAPLWLSLSLLYTATLTSLTCDFLRKRNPKLNESLVKMFRLFIRENELNGWAGTTFLLVGVCFSVWFFPEKITLLSLFFLAFADPIASYCGIRWGQRKIFGHKSLEGSLAAFVVCAFATAVFCWSFGVYTDQLPWVILLAGLAGSVSEAVPIFDLDDNLTFPVMSSLFLWLLFSMMNNFTEFPLAF